MGALNLQLTSSSLSSFPNEPIANLHDINFCDGLVYRPSVPASRAVKNNEIEDRRTVKTHRLPCIHSAMHAWSVILCAGEVETREKGKPGKILL
jgi:hypothetical protein